jgi:GT2 family glycosyltransferase
MKYTPIDVTFVLPSYNTLNYTMMAYRSIREFYPTAEIIILDDGSDDGTIDYLTAQTKLDDNLRTWVNTTGNIFGHTSTYDMGIKMAKNPIVTIFHSDMICAKNYLENMLKHYEPKTVVCATRIEPTGIYPEGKEKILKPFGIEFHEFKKKEFTSFVSQEQVDSKDQTSNGIFAPWLVSKEDFLAIGGHDAKSFAPYPEEDADLFLRFHLAGYKLIQSRDSLVFHFISRGHRSWAKNGVGKDDDMFKFYQNRARRNYLRKWHKWMMFDENHHPIAHPVYNIGFVITDVTSEDFLHFIETWATNIFIDNTICGDRYIAKEQPTTKIDLSTRIHNHGYIISSGVEDNAEMELGIFKMKTKIVKDISKSLIKV